MKVARAAALVGVLAMLTACSSTKTATTARTQATRVATTSAASTTSPAPQTTTAQGGETGTTIRLPVPDSAAIDAITKDLTKPRAAELTARCNAYVTSFQANGVTPGNEAAVMRLLNDLVDVVRPIDPAVADALASHAGAAAAWCRAKGLTNG